MGNCISSKKQIKSIKLPTTLLEDGSCAVCDSDSDNIQIHPDCGCLVCEKCMKACVDECPFCSGICAYVYGF